VEVSVVPGLVSRPGFGTRHCLIEHLGIARAFESHRIMNHKES
jgi:hypothetical protein